MLMDFGFDLAGRTEPRLRRGAMLSAAGAVMEALPLLIAYFVLRGVFDGSANASWIAWTGAALVGSVALNTAFRAWGGTDSFIATYGLVCDARLRLADHLRRLPMGFWSQRRTGSVGSVLTDEFALYTEIVTHVWSLVVTNLAKPIAIAVILTIVDWRLGLLSLVSLPLAIFAIPWSYRLLNAASDKLAESRSMAHARLVEYVQGIHTLREYGQAGPFHQRLQTVLIELKRHQMRTELAPAPALFAYKLLVWLGFCILLAVGAWMVAAGTLAPTRFLLAALLALQLYDSASEISSHLAGARFASRTLERIRELFNEPQQPDVETDETAVPRDAVLEVKDVEFSYSDRPAIAGVSARFEPGTVTALVGRSGSGKSTLAHLVTRLWDVSEGEIALGGTDVRELPLATLHQHIATVLQDVVLFRESVLENIRLGRPDATREDVVAAAKAARAHTFIETLPEGYDTVLDEGGEGLSGGQRQRISIARALLLDAPILVLDEATSSVDPHNEALIQQALTELTRGRTVLVIAHRLWTVQHADQILVLEEGEIVERGTHTTLLDEQGLYRQLWDTQQQSRGWRLDSPAPLRGH
ncbi:MAG: ABC transporter ATP-binding protein/permease [Nannocystaceae bacterium]|nr:ABC transporter ATP-binding protein/permease [Nannocystaceae bacterium]